MMWREVLHTDAGVSLIGASLLVGWLSGVAFTVCLFWRRITSGPTHQEEYRRLTEQRDEACTQVRVLLDQNARLAHHLIMEAGEDALQGRCARSRQGAA